MVVSIIGLNLLVPADIAAFSIAIPFFKFLLYLSSITTASLTNIPIRAITPQTLKVENGLPIIP